jgi:integrase
MARKRTTKHRIKFNYFQIERNSNSKSESTIRRAEAALVLLDDQLGDRPYQLFSKEDAIKIKQRLAKPSTNPDSDLVLNGSAFTTLRQIKAFLSWLSMLPGYRVLAKGQINFLNPSERDLRAAKSPQYKRIPTISEVEEVLRTLPRSTLLERRDPALIALLSLIPVRDGAVIGLKMKHVTLDEKLVRFPADEVHTKFGKNLQCPFLPVGKEIERVFVDWVEERIELGASPDSPLFPRTKIGTNENQEFEEQGLSDEHWQSAGPVRKIVQGSFVRIGVNGIIPHRFRHMINIHLRGLGLSNEELTAIGTIYGHENVRYLMENYGAMPIDQSIDVVRKMYEKNYDQEEREDSIPTKDLEELIRKRKKG